MGARSFQLVPVYCACSTRYLAAAASVRCAAHAAQMVDRVAGTLCPAGQRGVTRSRRRRRLLNANGQVTGGGEQALGLIAKQLRSAQLSIGLLIRLLS